MHENPPADRDDQRLENHKAVEFKNSPKIQRDQKSNIKFSENRSIHARSIKQRPIRQLRNQSSQTEPSINNPSLAVT